ncbi:Helix-turn-helix [uncultured archaeon]|nr:Helix-turn-helix [uncultured archaeon]
MKDLQTFKKEQMKDPAFKREYEKLAPRYAIISELIAARIKKGVTQKELALKVGTTQSSIARLEGGNVNPSLDFLQKIATVMGLSVHLAK